MWTVTVINNPSHIYYVLDITCHASVITSRGLGMLASSIPQGKSPPEKGEDLCESRVKKGAVRIQPKCGVRRARAIRLSHRGTQLAHDGEGF